MQPIWVVRRIFSVDDAMGGIESKVAVWVVSGEDVPQGAVIWRVLHFH